MQILFHIHRRAAYGTSLILIGSSDFLGRWDIKRATVCKWSTGDVWRAQVEYNPTHAAPTRIEFKFAIARGNPPDLEIIEWENNLNHAVSLPPVLPGMAAPTPIVVEAHWGAAGEIDLSSSPESWRAQSPPPTPASIAALELEDEEKLRRAVARLAVSQADDMNPTSDLTGVPNGSSLTRDTATAQSNKQISNSCISRTEPGTGASSSSIGLVRVRFTIKYRVEDGERIYVIGSIPELGLWNKAHAPRLVQPRSDRVVESGLWVLDMHLPKDKAHSRFEYKYFTRKRDGTRRWEGGGNRMACPFLDDAPKLDDGTVLWDDRWEKIRMDFSIYYPTNQGEVMHVTGSPPEIGAWFKPGPTPMKLGAEQTLETDVKGRKWLLSVWVEVDIEPFPYRYIVIDSVTKRCLWEREPNRQAEFDPEVPVVNSVHTFRDVNFVSGFHFDMVPPSMAIGPYPQTVEDVDALHEAGVTAVFNTQTDEDFEHRGIQWSKLLERYRKHAIQVVRYPIKDFDRVSLRKRLTRAAAEIDELVRTGKIVYIHCTAGMGRAPASAVAYLCLARRWALDEAVAHVKKHRIVAVPNVPVLQDVLDAAGHIPLRGQARFETAST